MEPTEDFTASNCTEETGNSGSVSTRDSNPMSNDDIYDCVVVGCGPVGAFAACLLCKYGLRTLVIEKDETPYSCPRAVALDDETVRIMNMYSGDLAAWVDDHTLKCPIDLRTGPPTDNSSWSVIGPSPPLLSDYSGYHDTVFFYQPEFEMKLRSILQGYKNCTMKLGTTVVDLEMHEASKTVSSVVCRDSCGNTQKYSAKWILATDGGSSFIRKKLGIPFIGDTFPDQPWLVIDVESDDPALLQQWQCFNFICDPKRPFVHVPLPGRGEERTGGRTGERRGERGAGRRYEFMLQPGEDPKEMMTQSSALLTSIGVKPSCVNILRQTVYTFHARAAQQWVKGNVCLAGDSAHCMPPFRGQGMCAGIRDAAQLCWRIATAIKFNNDNMLQMYQLERQRHLTDTTRVAVFMGAMITMKSRYLAYVRNLIFGFFFRFPLTKPVFKEPFSPPSRIFRGLIDTSRLSLTNVRGRVLPNYPVGYLDDDHTIVWKRLDSALHSQSGIKYPCWFMIVAPHVAVMNAVFRVATLTKELISPDIVEVQLLPPAHARVRLSQHKMAKSSGECNDQSPLWWQADICYADAMSKYHLWFSENACDAVLVRPDGFIFGSYKIESSSEACRSLLRMIQGHTQVAPSDLASCRSISMPWKLLLALLVGLVAILTIQMLQR